MPKSRRAETLNELIEVLEEYREEVGGDTEVRAEYRPVFPAIDEKITGEVYINL